MGARIVDAHRHSMQKDVLCCPTSSFPQPNFLCNSSDDRAFARMSTWTILGVGGGEATGPQPPCHTATSTQTHRGTKYPIQMALPHCVTLIHKICITTLNKICPAVCTSHAMPIGVNGEECEGAWPPDAPVTCHTHNRIHTGCGTPHLINTHPGPYEIWQNMKSWCPLLLQLSTHGDEYGLINHPVQP